MILAGRDLPLCYATTELNTRNAHIVLFCVILVLISIGEPPYAFRFDSFAAVTNFNE